jgi:membrane carboxypeptidase/penicillin-binding protein
MRQYIELRGDRQQMPSFEAPGNIVFLKVDRSTGTVVGDDSSGLQEAFIAGTQPARHPSP